MSETAAQADYVLPASSQFEKAEATFFNLEFPRNGFHLRQALFEPRPGTLTEAEIHARIVEALGELDDGQYRFLRRAARLGPTAFALAFAWQSKRDQRVARYAPVVLYRTLGSNCLRAWRPRHRSGESARCLFVASPKPRAARASAGRASAPATGCSEPSSNRPPASCSRSSEYADSWRAVRRPGPRINLHVPELMAELAQLDSGGSARDPSYPFILSAGERRSDTSNTAIRSPDWHRKGPFGTLRISPQDAASLGCTEGDWVRLTTRRGTAQAPVEITTDLQPGHVSLPNGQGIDYHRGDGTLVRRGVALNELTDIGDRDPIAGTPWHKHVAAADRTADLGRRGCRMTHAVPLAPAARDASSLRQKAQRPAR